MTNARILHQTGLRSCMQSHFKFLSLKGKKERKRPNKTTAFRTDSLRLHKQLQVLSQRNFLIHNEQLRCQCQSYSLGNFAQKGCRHKITNEFGKTKSCLCICYTSLPYPSFSSPLSFHVSMPQLREISLKVIIDFFNTKNAISLSYFDIFLINELSVLTRHRYLTFCVHRKTMSC